MSTDNSPVSVCSNALLMLGAQPINDFNENVDRARLAANLYPSFTMSSDQINPIMHLSQTEVPVVLTYGGEFSLTGSAAKSTITPTNINIKGFSTYGANKVRPVRIGTQLLWVQRSGKKLYAMAFNAAYDTFISNNITVLSDHITKTGIIDMAYQQEPESILWTVRKDGQKATLTIDQEQEVLGWSRQITDGAFEAVASIPNDKGTNDDVWCIVRRTINGSEVRYIERFSADKNGSVYTDAPSKEEYIKALGQDKGTMQYEAVQNWQKYGEFITDYSQMNPDEINTKVDALKPQDNDRGYAAKDTIYEAAKSAKNQILTQRLQQPFVAAVKAGFYKTITSANPDDITNEITRRYAAQDELHKLGINAPLLSSEEASPLSENIKKSTNIDGQMALLRNLGAQLPPDALKGVAAQIAPNSGAIAFSALILNTPDVVNNQVARINAMDRKEIYSAVDRAFNKKEAKKDDYYN